MNIPTDWNDLVVTAVVPVYNEETTVKAVI